MDTLGIIKEIDKMGRVVIPKDIRASLGLSLGDPVEIRVTTEGILITSPRYKIIRIEADKE